MRAKWATKFRLVHAHGLNRRPGDEPRRGPEGMPIFRHPGRGEPGSTRRPVPGEDLRLRKGYQEVALASSKIGSLKGAGPAPGIDERTLAKIEGNPRSKGTKAAKPTPRSFARACWPGSSSTSEREPADLAGIARERLVRGVEELLAAAGDVAADAVLDREQRLLELVSGREGLLRAERRARGVALAR